MVIWNTEKLNVLDFSSASKKGGFVLATTEL